jgi:hypothetical protein
MTCHPIPETGSHAANAKEAKENCTALQGPILSSLIWLVHKAHTYETAITAVFTIFLAIFTGTLWWATDGMLRATNETIKLARNEFNATHRPKIRLKNIWVMQPLAAEEPIIVDVLIINVGNALARIETFGIDFRIIDPGSMLPNDLEPPNLNSDQIGKTCALGFTIRFSAIPSIPFEQAQIDGIKDETLTLVCFGKVEYLDTGPIETRRIRRTSFYRVFKPFPSAGERVGRFIIPEKPRSRLRIRRLEAPSRILSESLNLSACHAAFPIAETDYFCQVRDNRRSNRVCHWTTPSSEL